MSLSLRLDLRQSQSLVMTPQLQQAIKLLQLSNLELAAYVERELEQNPLLERQEDPDDGAGAGESGGVPDADPPVPDGDLPAGFDLAGGDNPGWAGSAEDGWTDPSRDGMPNGIAFDSLGPVGRGAGGDSSDPSEDLEAQLSRPKTLREHLTEQLHLDLPVGPERLIGLHLIDLVDEAGYLTGDLDDVAVRLGCSPEQVEQVLMRLQHLDPPGVFARSLKECLALQLRDAGRLDPAMQALLDHLPLVAQADRVALIRICGVLPDDLPEMIAELKALNPKPGLAFTHEPIETIVPDVLVFPAAGGWRVELNAATLPKVLVNRAYHAKLSRSAGDRQAKHYVSERLQSANWLVKALDQRARTVLRVAEAVVERQMPFLERGVHYLRPLVLRDIAEATNLHESTVSRATADKYVATPRGNFPFKYFFSNGLPHTGGEGSHSAEAIRQLIRAMIEREDPDNVLSDDQIVEALRARDIAIARRTVAKYREALAIASSVQRRRVKALRLA